SGCCCGGCTTTASWPAGPCARRSARADAARKVRGPSGWGRTADLRASGVGGGGGPGRSALLEQLRGQGLEEGVQVVGDGAVPGGDGDQHVVAAVELHAGDPALGQLHAAHDQQVVALHHRHVLGADDGDVLVVVQGQQQLSDLEGDLVLGDVQGGRTLRQISDDHGGATAAEQVVPREDALATAVGGGQQAGAKVAGPVTRVHGQYVEVGPGGRGAAAAEARHAAMVRAREIGRASCRDRV